MLESISVSVMLQDFFPFLSFSFSLNRVMGNPSGPSLLKRLTFSNWTLSHFNRRVYLLHYFVICNLIFIYYIYIFKSNITNSKWCSILKFTRRFHPTTRLLSTCPRGTMSTMYLKLNQSVSLNNCFIMVLIYFLHNFFGLFVYCFIAFWMEFQKAIKINKNRKESGLWSKKFLIYIFYAR